MKKPASKEGVLVDAIRVSKKFGGLTRDSYRAHGKFSDLHVAKHFGTFAGLRAAVLDMVPPQPVPIPIKVTTPDPTPTPREIVNGVAALLRGGPKTRSEVCNKLKINADVLAKALESQHHYCITELGDTLAIDKPSFDRLEVSNINSGEWIRYGLVADTHLACREERLQELHACYDMFVEEGISTVFHAGNIVDGYIHKINGASVIVSTPDDQAQYVIDHYPNRKGIVTNYITGDDHEGWWIKEGFNWGNYLQMLANQQGRNDLNYIGHVEGDVAISNGAGKIILKVQHPGGGSAYARSYTAQKQVEAFQGGEKPQILVQGHYHVSNYMNDRNIHVIGMPGFQDQTVFARKKRLRMEIGGAILEFKQSPNDGSITRLRVEFVMFFDRGYYRKFLRSDCKVDLGMIVPA